MLFTLVLQITNIQVTAIYKILYLPTTCGVSIYISHTILHLNGSVLFKGNEADNGGGIYSTSSTVKFDGKSTVSFSDNSAVYSGGVIYQINSKVFFSGNSNETFTSNSATNDYGGARQSHISPLLMKPCMVKFTNNFAFYEGGAISLQATFPISHLMGVQKSTLIAIKLSSMERGAVGLYNCSAISFGGNSIITLKDNRAEYGGATSWNESTVSFRNQ